MKLLIGFPIAILGIIFRGFVVVKLWKWFVFGTFTDISLSIPLAIGLSTIGLLLSGTQLPSSENKEWWEPLVESICISVMCLLGGWIYQLFL